MKVTRQQQTKNAMQNNNGARGSLVPRVNISATTGARTSSSGIGSYRKSPEPTLPTLTVPGLFLAVAKKYSGKSHTLRYIIYRLVKAQKLHYGIVVSGTSQMNEDWDIVPKERRFDNWEKGKKAIEAIIKLQTKYKQEGNNIQAFIVLDDIVGLIKREDVFIQQLATSARHANITIFVAAQGIKQLPPIFRQNSEHVFIFRTSDKKVKQTVYEEWNGSLFGTFDEFEKMMNEKVQQYCVLAINNATQSNDKRQVFSLFRAPAEKKRFKVM